MPKSKLEREYQMDEDGTVVVEKDVALPIINESALKKSVKRPMSDKQRENLERMVAENKKRWSALREAKEKQLAEADATLKQEREELIEKGTHVRLKVREKVAKPRNPKEEVQQASTSVASKPVEKPKKKKHTRYYTDTSDDETETETETEESDDDLPPRRAVRQARRQMKTLAKIDEVINHVANPYMAKLLNGWK